MPTFQRSDDSWIVSVKRSEFPSAKRSWPSDFAIGTINEKTGVVDVWPQAWYTMSPTKVDPKLSEALAREILNAPATRKALDLARSKYRIEEDREGSFVVRTSDGKERRFHTMKRADEYADAHLTKLGRGSRAEFFRRPAGKSTLPAGTEPFRAVEVNEYGNIQMANLRRGGGGANLVADTGFYAARLSPAAGVDHFMPGGGGARSAARSKRSGGGADSGDLMDGLHNYVGPYLARGGGAAVAVNQLVGKRVEIAPHYDLWMRGARYGVVRSVRGGIANVRMDNRHVKNLAKIKVEDLKPV